MNYSLAVLLASDDVKLIDCTFDKYNSGKEYTFKTVLDVEPGDFVLVEAGSWYNVARVTNNHTEPNMNDNITYKWAFAKVDLGELDRLKEKENEAIKVIRNAELKRQRRALAQELGLTGDETALISFDSSEESKREN
jgi:hypothetical protein